MNVPDKDRCSWVDFTVRCSCPAMAPGSRMCIFHRHSTRSRIGGIVTWSANATPEEYNERVREFLRCLPSAYVVRLQAQIAAARSKAGLADGEGPGAT